MRLSAIIPVKRYTRAKTRLAVSDHIRCDICHLMLHEILATLKSCLYVDEIVVVTAEVRAKALCDSLDVTVLDDAERGVNEAVRLADVYLEGRGTAISLVIPQDIPLLEVQDISFLLKFFTPPTCVMTVPSIRFDGTNALLRCPPRVMGTHYDDHSYRNHMMMARQATPNHELVFVPNMMRDVDTVEDMNYVLNTGAKPRFTESVRRLLALGR